MSLAYGVMVLLAAVLVIAAAIVCVILLCVKERPRRVQTGVRCPKCREYIKPDFKVCPYCGAVLKGGERREK